MNIVTPQRIISPITGRSIAPKIVERASGDKILVEAHWIDHDSGSFLKRGIVKVLDAKTREDITNSVRMN